MTADNTIKIFKALGDFTRLRILNLLLERECCVCEVTEVLGISQTRASRNLSQLCGAGLISLKKAGLWSLYSVDHTQLEPWMSSILISLERILDNDSQAKKDRHKLRRITRILTTDSCKAGESVS